MDRIEIVRPFHQSEGPINLKTLYTKDSKIPFVKWLTHPKSSLLFMICTKNNKIAYSLKLKRSAYGLLFITNSKASHALIFSSLSL